jgi:hypothetical protein
VSWTATPADQSIEEGSSVAAEVGPAEARTKKPECFREDGTWIKGKRVATVTKGMRRPNTALPAHMPVVAISARISGLRPPRRSTRNTHCLSRRLEGRHATTEGASQEDVSPNGCGRLYRHAGGLASGQIHRGKRDLSIEQTIQTGIALAQVTPHSGPFGRAQVVERQAVDVALRNMWGHSYR